MKTFFHTCVVAFAVIAIADPAIAASGTIAGCVDFDDNRTQCNSGVSGSRHNNCGLDDLPFPEAHVQLEGVFGAVIGSGTTNDAGCFSFTFNDVWSGFPMANRALRVFLKNPSDFFVTNPSGTQYAFGFLVTLLDSNENVGTKHVGGGEQVGAYMTAHDVWERIVDPTTLLSSRMTGVRITTDHQDGSMMIDKNHVQISDGAGNNAVTTVAHELGHAVTAHSLDETYIIYDIFNCEITHTYFNAEDCDKVAWSEGIADFMAAVFAWTNNAPAAQFGANILETISDAADDCIGADFRTEACQAAALWDIFDDPTNDDDPLDDTTGATLANIVTVLDNYPGGCSGGANRCSNEGGEHGTNHWDFLANWNATFPGTTDEVRDIYAQTGIDEGGEEPF